MRVFALPDLGEGLLEAEIVKWYVREGEVVSVDQPLVSVETDKAVVDVPAPFAGEIERLFGQPGEVVRVGAPLVGFVGAAQDSGAIVGVLAATPVQSPPVAPQSRVQAAPAIRALARERGVDLATLIAHGQGGLITKEDVERAAAQRSGAIEIAGEPLRGPRRVMARNMALAHASVAAVTVVDDADIDHWPADAPITARLVLAVVGACRSERALNAWFDSEKLTRRTFDTVHLGIAIDTEDGLFVPVLRNCDALAEGDIANALAQLVRDARARTLDPESMRGATIVLSNFGAIGGRYASPVVVPPTVAIVGAGRLARRPVVAGEAVVPRRTLPISLTFDHRAVTGGEAARFLRALIAQLEAPLGGLPHA